MQVVAHTIRNQNMKGNYYLGVRKGAWTSAEDALLRKCIDEFGEGEWHKVPRRAGLNRCRKSCRLRWLNYLKPGIKRGEFEEDEVDMILRLHKLLGNRWSLIAARLSGRTANDIKNFWNTHIEKKATPRERLKEDNGDNNHGNKPKSIAKVEVIRPHPHTISKNLLSWLKHTYGCEVPNDNNGPSTSKNTSKEDNLRGASDCNLREMTGHCCSGGEDGSGAIPSISDWITLDAECFSTCYAIDFTCGDAQSLAINSPTVEGVDNYWKDLPSDVDLWKSLTIANEETYIWE